MKSFLLDYGLMQRPRILCTLLLMVTLISSPLHAAEGSLKIEVFKLQPVVTKSNTYKVQANLKYQLSEYLSQALLNGVTLKSNFQFFYSEHRDWVWNKNTPLANLNFQLKYHALSRHYLLSRNDTNEHWNFNNLPSALRKMGEIRNYELPRLPGKHRNNNNHIYAIARLGPSTLNLPLRIQSFLSDDYSLTSEEVRWPLP